MDLQRIFEAEDHGNFVRSGEQQDRYREQRQSRPQLRCEDRKFSEWSTHLNELRMLVELIDVRILRHLI